MPDTRPAPRWPRGARKSLLIPVLAWFVFVPFGIVHLYAGRWGIGLLLMVVYFGCAALLGRGHDLAMWGMVSVIAIDGFLGSEAILAHNRALRRSC